MYKIPQRVLVKYSQYSTIQRSVLSSERTKVCVEVLKMTPKLYYIDVSPPVRAVLLFINATGIEVELKKVDIAQGEHLRPEFLKLNPQHTVPTLEDGDFVIWDSHAINIYFSEKYATDDSLYPKDPKKKAVINQRLHFDSGVLFPALFNSVRPIFRGEAKVIPQEKIDRIIEGYEFLEIFLEENDYVAGDFLSIADFSIVASITSCNLLTPVDEEKFPSIHSWLKRMKSLPYYEKANQIGLNTLEALLKKKLAE